MRASLDTNVIIHLYRANMQNILFDIFKDGVFIYEQIRNIELEHHGKEVLEAVDADIKADKIELYTDVKLKTVCYTEPGILERFMQFRWHRLSVRIHW